MGKIKLTTVPFQGTAEQEKELRTKLFLLCIRALERYGRKLDLTHDNTSSRENISLVIGSLNYASTLLM